MADVILPLGSVVKINRENDNRLRVIIARACDVVVGNDEYYYDYGAVLKDEGMIDPWNISYFHREDIKKVVFKGFVNKEEEIFEQNYEAWTQETKLPKGTEDMS